MPTIIKDSNLKKVADSVKPDSKNRIVLSKVQIKEGITYHIYVNSIGQIVLDPQVTIPASETWLYENTDALAHVDKGMLEAANEKVINRGSFAKYVKDAPWVTFQANR